MHCAFRMCTHTIPITTDVTLTCLGWFTCPRRDHVLLPGSVPTILTMYTTFKQQISGAFVTKYQRCFFVASRSRAARAGASLLLDLHVHLPSEDVSVEATRVEVAHGVVALRPRHRAHHPTVALHSQKNQAFSVLLERSHYQM